MLTALQQLLAQPVFKSSRQHVAPDPAFALFYDALVKLIEQSHDSIQLLEQLQSLLARYQLVARSQYSDYFFAPHLAINQLAYQIAVLIATEKPQSLDAILYSRSLQWPLENTRWYDYIAGTDQLPNDHSAFAVADNGEICQLENLLDSVDRKFSEGQRNLAELWQSNDPRCLNQPLPASFLQAMQQRFPAFKAFYDHIARIVRTDTPYRKLHDLRTGLLNGSIAGVDTVTKGASYNAGTDANEAISLFSLWWDDIRSVNYQFGKSLRTALGELPGGQDGRNLEQFLAIIVREQSANISNSSNAATCVQLRGNELQEILAQNKEFLIGFEKHDLTAQKMRQYKENILTEFAHGTSPSELTYQSAAPVIVTNLDASLSYEQYAFNQLWDNFCQASVSEANILELNLLMQQLTIIQRQQLLHAPFDVAFHDKPILSALCHYLRSLESKLEKNCLLPVSEQQPLSTVEQALLTLIASNLGLLAMTSSRYESILFSYPQLVDIVFQHGVAIGSGSQRFTLQDRFNLSYYIDQKTRGKKDNSQQSRAAFHNLLGLPEPTELPLISPLHQAIKNGNQHECLALLNINPVMATHIDWQSGHSSLALAASYGQAKICIDLLSRGMDPRQSNKKGQVAEELWPTDNGLTNPFVSFHQALMVLAKNLGPLTERQQELLTVLKQHPHLLTWHIKDSEDTFLRVLFTCQNSAIIAVLTELPDWHARVALTEKDTLTILHHIAARGYTQFFPHMTAIAIDDQNNNLKRTALHSAAMYNRVDFCRLLLEQHAVIDLQDSEGHSALMLAAIRGHSASVALLLELGANPDVKNNQGKIALELCAKDFVDNPFLDLHQALMVLAKTTDAFTEKQLKLIEQVKQNGRFLTWQLTVDQAHFLAEIIKTNNQPLLNLLEVVIAQEISATSDAKGRTPVHMAAFYDQVELVELWSKPGDLDRKDYDGNTALMLAMLQGHADVVRRLLELGADPTLKNKHRKTACELWSKNSAENPISLFQQELTALTLTVRSLTPRQEVVFGLIVQHPHLLSWPFVIRESTHLLDALFAHASSNKLISLINQLSAKAHNVYAPHQRTLFQYAALHGRLELFHILIDLGCTIDFQDSDGNSPLMLAAKNGQEQSCHYLLSLGADPTLKNKYNCTAMTVWPQKNINNPISDFYQTLVALAKTSESLTSEQRQLLQGVCQQPQLLSWQPHDDNVTFLQNVFTHNNLAVLEVISRLPQWPALIRTNGNSLSLLHQIAARGYVAAYPYVNSLAIDDQGNVLMRTPLHLAALYGRVDFCRLLLSNQASFSRQDSEGHTALMLAAIKGHRDVFELLLAAGTDLTAVNKQGQTAEMLWLNVHPFETNYLTPGLRTMYLEHKKEALLAIVQPKPRTASLFSWLSSASSAAATLDRDAKLGELLTAVRAANFDHCPSNWTADDVLHNVLTSWRDQHHVTLNTVLMEKIAVLIKPSSKLQKSAVESNSRVVSGA